MSTFYIVMSKTFLHFSLIFHKKYCRIRKEITFQSLISLSIIFLRYNCLLKCNNLSVLPDRMSNLKPLWHPCDIIPLWHPIKCNRISWGLDLPWRKLKKEGSKKAISNIAHKIYSWSVEEIIRETLSY